MYPPFVSRTLIKDGEKALTMFCPDSFSPSLMSVRETNGGYMQVKEGGYCGEPPSVDHLLSSEVGDVQSCATLAQGDGSEGDRYGAFVYGISFRRGYCYGAPMVVDQQ